MSFIDELLVAFGLLLILEGFGPFAMPKQWQAMLTAMQQMPENRLRVMGLVMIAAGLLLISWLKN